MGSPPFAAPVLRAVCDRPRTTTVALVTRPDKPRGRGLAVVESPLVAIAREHGTPEHGVHEHGVEVLQPAKARDPEFIERLRALAPDVIVVASYGEILVRAVLDLPPLGCLNVHASLLPRHRGASPIQAAILAGDAETGVSIQRMVEALDEGDVLLEERTPIGAHENAGDLLERLSRLGATAIVRALDALESGAARFTPQDPARATFARKIKKEHGRIDWTLSAIEIDRGVRAFTPWPGARTTTPTAVEIVLLDVRAHSSADGGAASIPSAVSSDPTHTAGTILSTRPAFLVRCGTGVLEIRALKPAGKSAMDAGAWLRGARIEAGQRLGTT
jgi:methionyl-tRNA formyltransferase